MNGEGRRLARIEADAQILAARVEVLRALSRELTDSVIEFGRGVGELTRSVEKLADAVSELRGEVMR